MVKILGLLGILFVFMSIGQLSEIRQQTLHYGEYIEQYAIIHNVSIYGDFYSQCDTCIGVITIKTLQNNIILANKPMMNMEGGMFGYLASPNELQPNMNYRAIVNFTMPNGLSGFTDSMFIISGNGVSPTGISEDETNTGVCDLTHLQNCFTFHFPTLGEWLNSLFSGFNIKEFIKNVLTVIGLYPLAHVIYHFLIDITLYIIAILSFIITVLSFITDLILHPVDTILGIIPNIVDLGITLIVGGFALYLVGCLIVCGSIVAFVWITSEDKDPFNIIINTIKLVFKVFELIVKGIVWVIATLIRLVFSA